MKAFTKKQVALIVRISQQYELTPCINLHGVVGYATSPKNIVALNNLYAVLIVSGLNLLINDEEGLLLIYK